MKKKTNKKKQIKKKNISVQKFQDTILNLKKYPEVVKIKLKH